MDEQKYIDMSRAREKSGLQLMSVKDFVQFKRRCTSYNETVKAVNEIRGKFLVNYSEICDIYDRFGGHPIVLRCSIGGLMTKKEQQTVHTISVIRSSQLPKIHDSWKYSKRMR